jgi:alginate O-acetyltransferase complex protein AlgI
VLFSSPAFFVFFLVYFSLHQLVPLRQRVWLIIAGSAVFYAWWRIEYAWLPFALMATAYGGVRWMEQASTPAQRKQRATAAIVVLFLPLVFVKYTNFLYRDVLGALFGWDDSLLQLSLPLGISFVTFTLTAFIVDIYKRRYPGVPAWPTVLAYVLFFPHLIAGPILRPHELVPQLEHPRRTYLRRAAVPVAIFTMGLVKKLVFADSIAGVVDAIYLQDGGTLSAPSALLAIYGFSVQIYCDFSGYTDMAIGLALLLGVRLPPNFLRPYTAVSIVDFWRRWHITLSSWLRDYLYVPLGGNRQGSAMAARNVLITMTLGGLWHGASWTFVVWGLLHGTAVALSHALRRAWGTVITVPNWLAVTITFHFVTVCWIFFRAPTIGTAGDVFGAAVSGRGWANLSTFASDNLFTLALIAVFLLAHRFDDHRRVRAMVRRIRPEIGWPLLLFFWVLAIAVSQGNTAKFIYFDF